VPVSDVLSLAALILAILSPVALWVLRVERSLIRIETLLTQIIGDRQHGQSKTPPHSRP
jgi:hypothetical protein